MFRIGQKVVCVNGEIHPEWDGANVVCGHVYTVCWVGVDPDDGDEFIDLKELPSPESDNFYRGYVAACFRPLVERKADISIFKAMLTPSPVTVDAMNVADHAREIVG